VGHLASDLGEGTALALAALWALAALGRRWFLAGLVAAVALSQKALCLALGVGTLVVVLASEDRRRDLPRALQRPRRRWSLRPATRRCSSCAHAATGRHAVG
jgi:hypothetical protein